MHLCSGWPVADTSGLHIHARRFIPERQKWPCRSALCQNKKRSRWPATVFCVAINSDHLL